MEDKKSAIKGFFKKVLYYFLALIVIGLTVTLLICNFNYSEGNRSGVIIKFSKKGFLFKTYEGELNLGGINNIPSTAQANQIWEFSVNDQAMADTLMRLGGRKIMLHYHEKIKAMPWQGETNYFIDGFERITDKN